MRALPYRVMRNQPGRVEDCLRQDGIILITRKGEPFALMLDLAGQSLGEAFALLARLRAHLAIASMRSGGQRRGLDRMTAKEVQAEIDAARRSV